ncbi:MAG TPA: hypothetical protein VMV95_00780 [Bacillota bacterium]|nr:hypothetical protein [Bacillota bacterium]
MRIVLTPDWFVGNDILVCFFSLIVLIVISVLAVRSYRMHKKNKNLLYLGLGFGIIALAHLASLFTRLILYYDIGPSQAIGQAIITSHLVSSIDVFYYLGFFFHNLLVLAGLYIIYRLPQKKMYVGDYALVLYFILISTILSAYEGFFFLFRLTAFVLLILIINNYCRIYKENKFANTKILITVFSVLALAQLIYVFSTIDVLFVMASVVELISYIIFLFLIVRILKHGEKKKSYEHNIRHVGNNPGKKRRN